MPLPALVLKIITLKMVSPNFKNTLTFFVPEDNAGNIKFNAKFLQMES